MKKLNVIVRPVRIEDAESINAMRRMDGVRENTLGLFTERVTRAEAFIDKLTDNDYMLVAEVEEEEGVKQVVGVAHLFVASNPRSRHTAMFGIMVHQEFQGMGVGTVLMSKIVDLADNWLMLVRIELGVFVENEKAKKLYESFGFQVEGIKKYVAIRNGVYADEYLMARYRL